MNLNPNQTPITAGAVVEVVLPEPELEPELDRTIIDEAEKKLKEAFETFRYNWEIERTRKNGDPLPPTSQSIFKAVISEIDNPQVKAFLAHSTGKYFLAAISTEAWCAVTDYINNNWTGVDAEAICDRIRLASDALYKATHMYRTGGKEEIKALNPRLKFAVQYGCLTEKERSAIGKRGKVTTQVKAKTESKARVKATAQTKPAQLQSEPTEASKPNIDAIRGNLLSTNYLDNALWEINRHGLSLADVISCDELQAFCDKGDREFEHTATLLEKLNEPNYLTF